ncbi:MAG: hypothetical protein IJQ80_01170, partial [Clostridia bacterium]|nr:hypothetical protein [Clostridia bacterium]
MRGAAKYLIGILFIAFMIAAASFASYASDGDEYVGECGSALTVEEAHSTGKVAAIESASAQLKEGTAPENTVYFSGRTRRRSIGD